MTEYGKGCLPDKLDIRDYKLKKGLSMAVAYPESFECQRGPYIKSQGSVGSCVAHATSEVLEAHNPNGGKISTNFTYGIHKKLYGTLGPGMYCRDACKIAHEYGVPNYEYCAGNTEVTQVYAIAEEAFAKPEVLENAAKNRIDSFAKLRTVNDIKYALMNYGPVLASITWYSKNKVVNGILQKDGEKDGGHAIMIYGWNQNGFLMQNSWGLYWGVKGCCVIPYDYQLTDAYSFVPASSMDSDIIIPARNKFVDFVYSIINAILNLFIKHD